MDKNYTQFTMRIDNEVYKHLKESAEKHKRSIAKEIEYILEDWCKPSTYLGSASEEMNDACIRLLKVLKKEGQINIDI